MKKRLTKEEFIEKARKAHPGENLDYSKVNYVNMHTKVCIIDHDINPETGGEYGEYWQLPMNHLKGCQNITKGILISKSKRSLNYNDFIRRAKETHPDENLDYSKANYVNANTKVCIIDHDINPETGEEYGEYWQLPYSHLLGCSHPDKKNYKISRKGFLNEKDVIKLFKQLHPSFDYSKSKYNGYNEPIEVICHKKDAKGNEHGPFWTTPDSFIHRKCCCPKCINVGVSMVENDLYDFCCSFIDKEDISKGTKRVLSGGIQIDIYFKRIKLGLEFDGLYWHSDGSPSPKPNDYHLNKTEECEEKGIHLIHIFEDEWVNHQELVKERLKYILGKSDKPRIGARKCDIQKVSKSISDDFLIKNSLEGKASASVYLGAYYKGQLVSVMLFKKTKNEGEYELVRFISSNQFIIQGIASKLLKYFIKNYNPKSIIAFADRRWICYSNNIYINLGFKEKKILDPKLSYYLPSKGVKRWKNIPVDWKGKAYKIYDCGKIKYRLDIK